MSNPLIPVTVTVAFGTLLSAPAWSAELALDVELPKLNVAEYHRPYVAIWVEGADQKDVADLAVWYQVRDTAEGHGTKWLPDLRQWWRKSGRSLDLPIDGVRTLELVAEAQDTSAGALPPVIAWADVRPRPAAAGRRRHRPDPARRHARPEVHRPAAATGEAGPRQLHAGGRGGARSRRPRAAQDPVRVAGEEGRHRQGPGQKRTGHRDPVPQALIPHPRRPATAPTPQPRPGDTR